MSSLLVLVVVFWAGSSSQRDSLGSIIELASGYWNRSSGFAMERRGDDVPQSLLDLLLEHSVFSKNRLQSG